MKEDYLINIEGTMDLDGDIDTVRLMTRGSFLRKRNNYYISYRETQATGYEGNITTVKVEDNAKVSMLRFGPAPSQLVVENGRRHVCHYDSGFGVLNLGVAANTIDNKLTATGGKLEFSYTLDSGTSEISHNKVTITVQEANG